MLGEFELIQKLKNAYRFSKAGDDAAVLGLKKNHSLVFATDTIVEDVDFLKRKSRPESIGHKALAINLSDLAAMGARPSVFVIALGRPKSYADAWIERFYRGMMTTAKKFKIDCVGGDFSSSQTFFAAVSVLGECAGYPAVLRSGAKPGDWIGVTGSLGGSIRRKHLNFQPRLKAGKFLAQKKQAHAMIDLSDGLYQDLSHILKASGVGAELDAESVPVSSEALKLAKKNKNRALVRAFTDGEDFELLFTASPAQASKINRVWKKCFPRLKLSWIGKIKPGRPQIQVRPKAGKAGVAGLKKGFAHF